MFTKIIIGLILSTIISILAYKKKSLSISGVLSAIFLGTILYSIGHVSMYSLMIIFFILGSILSKINSKISYKLNLNSSKFLKESGCRNYIQVFANGGIPLIFSIMYMTNPSDLFIIASAAAFASATSDTFASEIGSLSSEKPHYLLSRKNTDTGLSGGVTRLGFFASLLGTFIISFSFVLIITLERGFNFNFIFYGILVFLLGFLGSIIDSILGEKFQVKYYSNVFSGKLTEKSMENDIPNKIAFGHPLMDNNMVNFLSILISASLTFIFV